MLVTISNSWIESTVSIGKSGFVICSLKDLTNGKEWIYKEDRITEDRDGERTYDEQYAGGMEFLFPGDMEEMYAGRSYKDHGIIWRIPFEVSISETRLEAKGIHEEAGIRVDIRMEPMDRKMLFSISIKNISQKEMPYLLRLHPAFLIEPDMVLEMNEEEIFFEEDMRCCSFSTESAVEIRRPKTWEEHELFFHVRQNKGEFVVRGNGEKLRVQYDKEKLHYLTVYSFKRDSRRIAIIEPANIAGMSLSSASKRCEVPVLLPGEKRTYDFIMIPE